MTPLSRKKYIRQCKFADIFFLYNGSSHDYSEMLDFIVHFYCFMYKEVSFNMFCMEFKTSLEFFYNLGEGQTPLKLGQN